VDAHTHLDDPRFDGDRGDVLARARSHGIGQVVLAAGNPLHWARVRAVAEQHDLPYCIGIHPWWPEPRFLDALPEALAGACGVGETGLDHHRAQGAAERRVQRQLLDAHLALASERHLPVVLHHVRATREVLDAVAASGVRQGVLHAFVRGDVARALELGLHVSFGTDLARSHRALQAAIEVPLDRILFESDAPDRPLSGDRGEPAHVADLVALVADARGLPSDELLARSGDNARRLFRLGGARP
jgi:TatD DNase family protein